MERRNERTRETIDNLVGFFPGDLSKFHFLNLLTSPAENVELAAKKNNFSDYVAIGYLTIFHLKLHQT